MTCPGRVGIAPCRPPFNLSLKFRLPLTILRWRPFLCAVYDVYDFHNNFQHPVDHHEGKRWQGKFTSPSHAARSTLVWKKLQRTCTFIHRLSWPCVERQPDFLAG